jgi:hypothetical protein
MRRIGLQLCMVALFGVAGCAYTVPLTSVEIDKVPNRHGTKIPGQFSVQIATEDCCKKEVRSELLMCQAPTYHVNGDQAVKASVQAALPAVFEDAVIGQGGRANDLTITISRFDVAVRFDPVGVVPTVHATADVGFTIEARQNGKTYLTGHTYAQQANVGSVVFFCAEASSTIADAVNTATREALGKLTELMMNSPTLRDLGGPSLPKRAQAK